MPMVVRLDDDLAEYVRVAVASGKFSSEEAVVNSALRQMRDKNEKKAEIRRIMLEQASQDPKQLIS